MKISIPKKTLIPLLAVLIFTIGSYAASVSVTTSQYQAYQGVQFNVTGNFSAQSNGFFVAQSAISASSQPCTWSNGQTCSKAVTAGDWYYSITLTVNTAPSTTTTYTVTVQWNTGSGYSQMGPAGPSSGQLTVSIPSTASGQTMTFIFDTGSSNFNAPSGIVVTVA